jgi:hypothetical protein
LPKESEEYRIARGVTNTVADPLSSSASKTPKFAILKRVREIGSSYESGFHLILDPPADKDAAF